MSAYDNPAIIKDDTAMAWAQATSGAGEAFMQSFNQARKEREAKEKEARLEAKKIAEEKKQQDITDQIFISEARYNEQERLTKIDQGLEKSNVSASGVALYNEYYISTGKVQGDYDFQVNRRVVGPEKAQQAADYSAKRAQGAANLERVTGALYAQAQEIKNGEINDTNISTYRYKGNNIIDQAINRNTAVALAFPDDEKTIKKLTYDPKGDPSDITLDITTKVGNWNDLVKSIRNANLSINEKEVENQINEELKKSNGRIKVDNEGNYSINYTSKINDKEEGILYVKIPKVIDGTGAIKAGVYSKDTDTEISNIYLKPLEFVDLEGNANLSAEQGKVMYKRTPVAMDAIEQSLKPQLLAKAQGLVASYMQDPTTTDGILVDLGFPNTYYSKEFAKLGLEEKVNAIADKLLEKEKENIIKKSELQKIGDQYYKMDQEDIRVFSEKTKSNKKGGGQTGTQKNQAAFNERIRKLIKTKQGGVSKGGYTLQILDGRWGLYDKDGIPKVGTENITDPSVLATFIGGTLD